MTRRRIVTGKGVSTLATLATLGGLGWVFFSAEPAPELGPTPKAAQAAIPLATASTPTPTRAARDVSPLNGAPIAVSPAEVAAQASRPVAEPVVAPAAGSGASSTPRLLARPVGVSTDAVALCGDPRLIGRPLERIVDADDPVCGVADPVAVEAASGVLMSPPATLNCRTAGLLADWLEADQADGAQAAALAARGAAITEIRHVSAYVCRPVGDRPDARRSLHSFGAALDIAAFRLADDSSVNVLDGWENPEDGPFLRALWSSACGPFGTVLGPEADAAHRDHFHFDTAQRREAYCR